MGECCITECQHQVQWAAAPVGALGARVGICQLFSQVRMMIVVVVVMMMITIMLMMVMITIMLMMVMITIMLMMVIMVMEKIMIK